MLKQQSHIVAPIPDELRTRALYTVDELRQRGKADKEAIDKLFALIVDLTDNGLDFFFLEPLRRSSTSSRKSFTSPRHPHSNACQQLISNGACVLGHFVHRHMPAP